MFFPGRMTIPVVKELPSLYFAGHRDGRGGFNSDCTPVTYGREYLSKHPPEDSLSVLVATVCALRFHRLDNLVYCDPQ